MTGIAKTGQDAPAGRWRDMVWLARQDIRRGWLAYLASMAYLLVFGALGAPREDMGLGSWSPEFLFLIMMMLLAEPFLSREYFSWDNDRVAERLTFLRVLPIPLGTIVGGRMLAISAALIPNVPVYFLALWIVGDWELSRLEFVWFALFWIGVSVGLAGYSICMEMGTSIKRYSFTNLGLLTALFAAIVFFGVRYDAWVVRGSVGLIERFGPVMSLASLVIGILVYLAAGRVATRLLRERVLTP